MDLLKKAMKLTEANISNMRTGKAQVKDKRQVAYKTETGINYLVPGTMKIKSFDRLVNKNADAIAAFENNDKSSLNLT